MSPADTRSKYVRERRISGKGPSRRGVESGDKYGPRRNSVVSVTKRSTTRTQRTPRLHGPYSDTETTRNTGGRVLVGTHTGVTPGETDSVVTNTQGITSDHKGRRVPSVRRGTESM